MKTTSLYHRLKQQITEARLALDLTTLSLLAGSKNMVPAADFPMTSGTIENNIHRQVSLHGCHQLTKSESPAASASCSFNS
jgi:hypothetical protein